MFCTECGAQLLDKDGLTTQNISTDKINTTLSEPPQARQETFQQFEAVDAWGSMHLLETGQVLPLSSRNEFTLGRISEGQPIMPDIDLTPYNAYVGGVSRLHAIVKRDGSRIVLMDLGSANGTYINGKRLEPNVEQVINHGDIVALGKLKIQFLFKNA
jgi:hypothetical protein